MPDCVRFSLRGKNQAFFSSGGFCGFWPGGGA
jgi:hypothetical protein